MEVSKITFTEETKKAMKKKLTNRERGKILYSRLLDIDSDGKLSQAKNRKDICRMIGCAASWVDGMIRRGFMTETLGGFEDGSAVNYYALTGKRPDYDYNRTFAKQRAQIAQAQKDKPILNNMNDEPVVLSRVAEPTPSIVLALNNITVKVENATVDYLVSLVKQLSK